MPAATVIVLPSREISRLFTEPSKESSVTWHGTKCTSRCSGEQSGRRGRAGRGAKARLLERAHVPQAQGLVLRAGGHEVRVGQLLHHLHHRGVPEHQLRLHVRLGQIKPPDFGLLAPRVHVGRLGRPVGGAHYVPVLEFDQLVPGDRVPDLGREVGRARDRPIRLLVERGAPHRALVALEGAHPVARVAAPQHRRLVVARGDEEDAVVRLIAELDARHRPRVARTYDDHLRAASAQHPTPTLQHSHCEGRRGRVTWQHRQPCVPRDPPEMGPAY